MPFCEISIFREFPESINQRTCCLLASMLLTKIFFGLIWESLIPYYAVGVRFLVFENMLLYVQLELDFDMFSSGLNSACQVKSFQQYIRKSGKFNETVAFNFTVRFTVFQYSIYFDFLKSFLANHFRAFDHTAVGTQDVLHENQAVCKYSCCEALMLFLL